MSVPHTLHQSPTIDGLTLPLPAGPTTVLSTHPHFEQLVAAAAHPVSTGAFLARLVERSAAPAGATR